MRPVPQEERAGVQVQQVPEERHRQVMGAVAQSRGGGVVASAGHYAPVRHDEAVPFRAQHHHAVPALLEQQRREEAAAAAAVSATAIQRQVR